MSINLIVAIIAYIVAIGAGFYYFMKKQYKTYFDVSSSFSVCFLFFYLNFTLGWHWLCSMALPIAIYYVTIILVKQIATKVGE